MDNNIYSNWHKTKSKINQGTRAFFHEREIWFCSLGKNVGFEQDGKGPEYLRPVIVLRKFNNSIAFIVPITKSHKVGQYYFKFKYKENIISNAIISQLRLIDSKRFRYLSGRITSKDFEKLKQKISKLLVC